MRLVSLFALAAAAAPVAALPARQAAPAAPAQTQGWPFVMEEAMIPMRDGTKLHTVILRPRDQKGPLPILFGRTPYGASARAPQNVPANWAALARDGYIFVSQDMRGRFQSEGGPFTLSTEIKTGNPLGNRFDCREENDRHTGLSSKPATDRETVELRQHHIEDDQIWGFAVEHLQRLLAVFGADHAVVG